eukprot:CAMPEP_0171996498 /NCGR_PEP_ID=MMETSP1041-20130122/158_1 /TAXON_ID=464988 /ORGANISM="Hemiselmis andersenii, Strain CCMP439" /LENGTH=38 /DNA_ID= /DNA_START= /DNA_END= /DNA_ORIENTATION=
MTCPSLSEPAWRFMVSRLQGEQQMRSQASPSSCAKRNV